VSGLSATQLEYIVLGMSLLYTVVAFFEWKAGRKTVLGRLLGAALMLIPFAEAKLRAMRERARVKEKTDDLP